MELSAKRFCNVSGTSWKILQEDVTTYQNIVRENARMVWKAMKPLLSFSFYFGDIVGKSFGKKWGRMQRPPKQCLPGTLR